MKWALTRCHLCGGIRMLGAGVHAPRWRLIAGKSVRVDCVGKPIQPES